MVLSRLGVSESSKGVGAWNWRRRHDSIVYYEVYNMKRSKMVELMALEIYKDNKICKGEAMLQATDLLDKIESAGMLPPKYQKIVKTDAHPRHKNIYDVYEWEPEKSEEQ